MGQLKFLTVFAFVFTLFCAKTQGFYTSCNGRCHQQPSLIDHMSNLGCYCHDACSVWWGDLKCCSDKSYYCDGSQACNNPPTLSGLRIVGPKLYYAKGETTTYECSSRRKEIRGSATRTCLGSNIWSRPPSCSYSG